MTDEACIREPRCCPSHHSHHREGAGEAAKMRRYAHFTARDSCARLGFQCTCDGVAMHPVAKGIAFAAGLLAAFVRADDAKYTVNGHVACRGVLGGHRRQNAATAHRSQRHWRWNRRSAVPQTYLFARLVITRDLAQADSRRRNQPALSTNRVNKPCFMCTVDIDTEF